MKVVCKVKHINTLTYLKVYEVLFPSSDPSKKYVLTDRISDGYVIIDDFENKQYYYNGYFMSIDEARDLKIDLIFKN
jgi:hypothetical protein